MPDIDQDRLDRLEAHVAHQEGTIQDLSEMIARQWEVIEDLKRRVDRQVDRLGRLETDVESVLPQDAPPPHY